MLFTLLSCLLVFYFLYVFECWWRCDRCTFSVRKKVPPLLHSICIQCVGIWRMCTYDGTERNRTEWNKTEQNETERNGMTKQKTLCLISMDYWSAVWVAELLGGLQIPRNFCAQRSVTKCTEAQWIVCKRKVEGQIAWGISAKAEWTKGLQPTSNYHDLLFPFHSSLPTSLFVSPSAVAVLPKYIYTSTTCWIISIQEQTTYNYLEFSSSWLKCMDVWIFIMISNSRGYTQKPTHRLIPTLTCTGVLDMKPQKLRACGI